MNLKQPELAVRKKHSILGIISFACALLFLIFIVLALVISQFYSSGGSMNTGQITINRILIGCVIFLNPLSIVLGIIALFQKNTKKLFPILGISLSILSGLLLIGAFVLAFIYSSSM